MRDPLAAAFAHVPDILQPDAVLDQLRAANIAEAIVQGARMRKAAILAALRIGPLKETHEQE